MFGSFADRAIERACVTIRSILKAGGHHLSGQTVVLELALGRQRASRLQETGARHVGRSVLSRKNSHSGILLRQDPASHDDVAGDDVGGSGPADADGRGALHLLVGGVASNVHAAQAQQPVLESCA